MNTIDDEKEQFRARLLQAFTNEKKYRAKNKKPKLTKELLAETLSVTPQSVGKWFKKGTISKEKLPDLAKILRVDYVWLSIGGGTNNHAENVDELVNHKNNVYALHKEDDIPKGIIMIDSYKVSYSMGDGSAIETTLIEEDDPVPFKESYFTRNNINPNHCKRFTSKGDSMFPTICDKDSVLVNMNQNTIIDGKVYALRYGNELKVKRLYKQISGGIVIHSDNVNVPDENISKEDCNDLIDIHGQVIDRSGSGGL